MIRKGKANHKKRQRKMKNENKWRKDIKNNKKRFNNDIQIKKEKTFDKVWKQVEIELLKVDYFFAHNAPFDRSVLHSSCNYYNIDLPPQEFKDTVILARKYWEFENNKLNTVCKNLRIPLNHHDALSDAKGCAMIAIEAFKKGYFI